MRHTIKNERGMRQSSKGMKEEWGTTVKEWKRNEAQQLWNERGMRHSSYGMKEEWGTAEN